MSVTRLLITALGGEGGGVLTGWIVAAARDAGLAVQATSVPGVPQRTGATTYYIELAERHGGAADPIFALMPVAGDVDILLASELLEAARMVERGYVTADRTFLLASTHRVLTTREKMARGDGRLDAAALLRCVEGASQERFLFDADKAARASRAPMNAVLLGVLAGTGRLAVPAERLRGAIAASGIAMARNLAGFDAGLARAGGAMTAPQGRPAPATAPDLAVSLRDRVRAVPEAAREVVRLGVARLADYQDAAYGELYLDRLRPFTDDPGLLRAVARHLAVRMSFGDMIRVAQLKLRASRFERIREGLGAAPDEPVEIVEFFKPGLPELADLLPPALGRRLLAWAERRGFRDTAAIGLRLRSSTISGVLRLWLLAKLKPWRRRSLRFAAEQAAIDGWLALVGRARGVSGDFALETAELARLVKGYGETYRRGQASYRRLVDELVTPVLGAGSEVDEPAAQLRGAIAGLLAAP